MRTAATVIKASCRVLPFRNYRVPIAVAVGGDLSAEPNSETWIGLDEGVHLTRTMLTSMSLVHAFANR